MQFLDLARIAATPWKNGGGATRQLAVWPPGAGLADFDWRVSVADVAVSGPFSLFPGVERHLMLLQGDGFALYVPDGSVVQTLATPWQPWTFSGDSTLHCRLLGGPCVDFNLMLRRGRWRGGVQLERQACTPGSTPAGLCLVLAGGWTDGHSTYTAGQGLWWSFAAPGASWRAQPGAQAAALAWVGLEYV